MIKSFKDRRAQAIFEGRQPGKGFPASIILVTRRKHVMLHEAETLDDLRRLPGNHLEALKKYRTGQHSIRINDQYRICFEWTGSDAKNVEIVDCHCGVQSCAQTLSAPSIPARSCAKRSCCRSA